MLKPNILILSTGNSARGQIAEALFRKHAGDRFGVYSAGTDPKPIDALTYRVLNEKGLDISGQHSKHLGEYLGRLMVNYLVVVCCDAEKNHPLIWPGAAKMERMFWPIESPATMVGSESERMERFRNVRDQLDERIGHWVAEVDLKRKAA